MNTQRMRGVLRLSLALAILALMLVTLGLVLTGPAGAAGADVVQFGEDVTVSAGERVATVVAGGGDVTIDGTVSEDVVAFGGDVLVRGTVEGSLICFGGDLRLAATAVVGSANKSQDPAIVLIGGMLTREPGAQVTGDVQTVDNVDWGSSLGWVTKHTVVRPWWGFTLMGWIVQTAFFLVLGLVAAALMPKQMRALQRGLRLKPAASLGWGALTFFVVAPTVFVVLVISVVGWLILIPYGLLVLLAYFFATTGVAAFVAQRVLAGTQHADNLMLSVTLGVVGTTIVSRIPVLGSLFIVVMILFGIGAGILAFVEWRRARKQAAGVAPAGSPIPGAPPAAFGDAATAVAAGGAVTAATSVVPAAEEQAAAEHTQVAAAPAVEGPTDEPPVED